MRWNCAAASRGSSCRSPGGAGKVVVPGPVNEFRKHQQIAPLPCCFGNETEMVFDMVIYTVVLPGILSCRNIPS
jgi:hypothetical protein